MPRIIKQEDSSSDEEIENTKGRKTRLATSSTAQTTRITRSRSNTMDINLSKMPKLRSRESSISSDISEMMDNGSQLGTPTKRLTRRTVLTMADSPKPPVLSKQLRGSTENISSPSRVTRSGRAGSVEPDTSKDAKPELGTRSLRSRTRKSVLSPMAIAEESESKMNSDLSDSDNESVISKSNNVTKKQDSSNSISSLDNTNSKWSDENLENPEEPSEVADLLDEGATSQSKSPVNEDSGKSKFLMKDVTVPLERLSDRSKLKHHERILSKDENELNLSKNKSSESTEDDNTLTESNPRKEDDDELNLSKTQSSQNTEANKLSLLAENELNPSVENEFLKDNESEETKTEKVLTTKWRRLMSIDRLDDSMCDIEQENSTIEPTKEDSISLGRSSNTANEKKQNENDEMEGDVSMASCGEINTSKKNLNLSNKSMEKTSENSPRSLNVSKSNDEHSNENVEEDEMKDLFQNIPVDEWEKTVDEQEVSHDLSANNNESDEDIVLVDQPDNSVDINEISQKSKKSLEHSKIDDKSHEDNENVTEISSDSNSSLEEIVLIPDERSSTRSRKSLNNDSIIMKNNISQSPDKTKSLNIVTCEDENEILPNNETNKSITNNSDSSLEEIVSIPGKRSSTKSRKSSNNDSIMMRNDTSQSPDKRKSLNTSKKNKSLNIVTCEDESEVLKNNETNKSMSNDSLDLSENPSDGKTIESDQSEDEENDDDDQGKEYNLSGVVITEYSDNDVPGDDCRASEEEFSDPEDEGSDLADFVVEDDQVEDTSENNDEEDGEEEHKILNASQNSNKSCKSLKSNGEIETLTPKQTPKKNNYLPEEKEGTPNLNKTPRSRISISPDTMKLLDKLKLKSFASHLLNQSTSTPNSDTPRTKYLRKDKLNESGPMEIKYGGKSGELIIEQSSVDKIVLDVSTEILNNKYIETSKKKKTKKQKNNENSSFVRNSETREYLNKIELNKTTTSCTEEPSVDEIVDDVDVQQKTKKGMIKKSKDNLTPNRKKKNKKQDQVLDDTVQQEENSGTLGKSKRQRRNLSVEDESTENNDSEMTKRKKINKFESKKRSSDEQDDNVQVVITSDKKLKKKKKIQPENEEDVTSPAFNKKSSKKNHRVEQIPKALKIKSKDESLDVSTISKETQKHDPEIASSGKKSKKSKSTEIESRRNGKRSVDIISTPQVSRKRRKLNSGDQSSTPAVMCSASGSSSQFMVVNLDKVKKRQEKIKKANSAASFRQKMLARNSRVPMSKYLMFVEKQKTLDST